MSRDHRKRPDPQIGLPTHKCHKPAEADQISKQLPDVVVVPLHSRKGQSPLGTRNDLEAHEAQTLAAVGRVVDVSDRVK